MSLTADLIFDAKAELAEGPVWHEGALWWVNILAGELHQLDVAAGAHDSWRFGGTLGCAIPCMDGRWVLAHNRRLILFEVAGKKIKPICEPEIALPGNRFNDGKCDPAGRLWVGTMSREVKPKVGALYRLDSSLQARRMVEGVTISNGLAWSADARTIYYTDTFTQRVEAFDFDLATGEISGRRTLAKFPASAGSPDGMAIDENDNLWVALWGGGAVVCLDGRNGKELARVCLPVSQPSSCAFGGTNFEDLFITSAAQGLSAEQRAQEPHAGGIFRVRPGVRGLPTVKFKVTGK